MENENKVVPEVTPDETVETVVSETNDVVEATTSETPATEMRCQKCQALITDGQAFCPECGNALKKVCQRCGLELQNDQSFCPSCGLNVAEMDSSNSTNINEYNTLVMNNQKKPKTMKIILGVIIAVCVCVVLLFVTNEMGKTALHNKLMDDEWSGLSSDGDTLLYLEFEDDEIDYSGYFGILGKRNVAMLDYEVVSKNKISVRGREINVKFSKDGDTVTFSPSFTDTRSATVWSK